MDFLQSDYSKAGLKMHRKFQKKRVIFRSWEACTISRPFFRSFLCKTAPRRPHLKNKGSLVFIGHTPVLARMKFPFGKVFNSSGAINGLLIICRLWLGLFFPLDIEPDNTVLFPNAFDKISALSEFGAKPPNKISWQLSMIILEPSFP